MQTWQIFRTWRLDALKRFAGSEQADPDAFDGNRVGACVEYDGRIQRIFGQQLDDGALALPTLDGDFVSDPRHDDLAIAGFLCALDCQQVAVEDARVAHAHAAYP